MEPEREFSAIKSECNSVSSVEEFDKICRCCLSPENICLVFEVLCEGENFCDILHFCTSIHVEKDDILPKNICYKCINKVIEFNNFKNQCSSSENTLKNILLQKDLIKNETNDIEEIIIHQQDDQDSIKLDEDTECNDDIFQTTNTNTYKNNKTEKRKRNRRPKQPKMPTCERCNKTFETKEELKEHRSKEKHFQRKDQVCKHCNKTISHGHMALHLRVHTKEKPYQCPMCPARFSIKGNMRRHVKSHTGEKPHKCETCGMAFIQRNTLTCHMRTHTGENNYLCNECGQSFKYRIGYKNHLRKVHSVDPDDGKESADTSPTKCDICKKEFSTVGALGTHKLIHGERNFLCNYCGKGCFSKAALKSHLIVHKNEKPYKCPQCPKSFGRPTLLKCHILTHTGQKRFVCKVCNRAFTQQNHLTYHKRTHSGERPYACSYCGTAFALKWNLTVHVRKHTGETPHVCDVCEKGFYDSSSLKKHKKSHGIDN